jgi:hypothetical protein
VQQHPVVRRITRSSAMVETMHSHATRPEEVPTTEGVEDDVSSDDVLKNFIKRKKPKRN